MSTLKAVAIVYIFFERMATLLDTGDNASTEPAHLSDDDMGGEQGGRHAAAAVAACSQAPPHGLATQRSHMDGR